VPKAGVAMAGSPAMDAARRHDDGDDGSRISRPIGQSNML
jgi:hypothetical protein